MSIVGRRFTLIFLGTPTETHLRSDKWKQVLQSIETSPIVWMNESAISGTIDYKLFNDQFIPQICNALQKNKVITELRINYLLHHVGMKSVCKMLQTHATIIAAGIYDNPFTKQSMGDILEDLISLNKTLKTLRVDIGSEDVKCVARALPRNSTLTALDFRQGRFNPRSYMDDKGLGILCEGLKHNRSITSICLSWHNIGDEGAAYLLSVLEVNHTIVIVDLSFNRIVNLPEGFAFLTHIKEICLDQNPHLRFPPPSCVESHEKLEAFFAGFRSKVKWHFLLGFHKRVGSRSAIQSYFSASSIFEPALVNLIFELVL